MEEEGCHGGRLSWKGDVVEDFFWGFVDTVFFIVVSVIRGV